MRPRTLKTAAEAGDLAAVQYHLSQGARINATTAAGHFPLGGAIINRHPRVVEFLIANGANIDQLSEFGWSPLYLAAWTGNAEIAALLLLAGANTATKTRSGWNSPDGYSPLHIASEKGHLAVVMLLVAAGTKVEMRNGLSETALDLAARFGNASIVEFLRKTAESSLGEQKATLTRSGH